MSGPKRERLSSLEAFPGKVRSTEISVELNRLRNMLRHEFPDAEKITFSFEGELQAHIDIRDACSIRLTELRLARLGGGIFQRIRHSRTPNRPFLHRVNSLVVR